MIFKIIIWAIAAILLLVPVIIISSLFVNPKKEYDKHSKYYRFLLNISTGIVLKVLRIKVDVTGAEKLPKDQRFLLVSNHRSNFDPIITWYMFREHTLAFVSKAENFKLPFFGRIIRKCCFIAIDRESPRKAIKTIDKAAELIKSDQVSMAIYPEGTRSKDGKLLPFHNGVLKIAKKAEVSIAVISISGTETIHKKTPWHASEVKLDVLEVIPAEEVRKMNTAELGGKIREEIERNLVSAEI